MKTWSRGNRAGGTPAPHSSGMSLLPTSAFICVYLRLSAVKKTPIHKKTIKTGFGTTGKLL